MQKLHLVGFTTDHRALILSPRRGARSGGFVLEIDDAFTAAMSDAAEKAAARAAEAGGGEEVTPPPPPRPQSTLPVRELQARLRAGRSVEEVAAEAGVDPEWVARFAAPVVAEQRRVVAATQSATFLRSRLGASALPLGESIRRNLADRGLALTSEELDGGWSARQVADGRWLVSLAYRSRGRRQEACWELDVRTGSIRARDRLAGDLAFVAGGPRPATTPVPKPTRVPATEPSDGDREAARRVAVARKAAEAQLHDAARAASKRDAEVARRAVARPRVEAAPAPTKATPAKAKAKAKAKATAVTAKRKEKTKAVPAAKHAAPAKKSARAPASKQAAPAPAKRKTKAAPPTAAKQTTTAAPATKKATATTTPAHARTTATSRPSPGDAVADALAAVRREVEQELTAFATRRQRPAHAAPPQVDLAHLDGPRAPAPPPVFRGDVAPAGSPNGATPEAAAPRRRRREPLRAR